MSYVLSGRLRARCSRDVVEPVGNETVLLYWVAEGERASAYEIRSHEEARSREYLLLAQGRTDADGSFRIDLAEDTLLGHRGSTREYAGGPLTVEVYYRGAGSETEPVQFSLGKIQPQWHASSEGQTARLDHEIPAESWSRVRAALDLWTVAGFVRVAGGGAAAGYRVSAYDADAVRDDFLGAAESEADGSFRIDYPGSRFRPAPVAGVDVERGGPELYFRVEAPDGSVAYEEASSRGSEPDRANASNWFTVDISIDQQEVRAPLPAS